MMLVLGTWEKEKFSRWKAGNFYTQNRWTLSCAIFLPLLYWNGIKLLLLIRMRWLKVDKNCNQIMMLNEVQSLIRQAYTYKIYKTKVKKNLWMVGCQNFSQFLDYTKIRNPPDSRLTWCCDPLKLCNTHQQTASRPHLCQLSVWKMRIL